MVLSVWFGVKNGLLCDLSNPRRLEWSSRGIWQHVFSWWSSRGSWRLSFLFSDMKLTRSQQSPPLPPFMALVGYNGLFLVDWKCKLKWRRLFSYQIFQVCLVARLQCFYCAFEISTEIIHFVSRSLVYIRNKRFMNWNNSSHLCFRVANCPQGDTSPG